MAITDLPTQIEQGAKLIRAGKLVIFPTETVYGIGADGLNPEAIQKIYAIKKRPQDNPVIIHISQLTQLKTLVKRIPKTAQVLMERWWPGPLTILLERNALIPDIVTAGTDKVAIRMPDNPIALALITAAQTPIAAPSANTSGKPSPTNYNQVMADLGAKADLVIDGGQCQYGLESTVIDMTDEPIILRPGAITKEQIDATIGPVATLSPQDIENGKSSPGVAFKHYAPNAPLQLYPETPEMPTIIRRDASQLISAGKKVAIIGTTENAGAYPHNALFYNLGSRQQLTEIAARLFNALHFCNQQQVDIILCETFPKIGIGVAIMDRLERASNK